MDSGDKKVTRKNSRGARNLLIMGIIAIVLAVSTTGVSLAIYHNSGDIYLDRSRPGFLPDEEEIEEEGEEVKNEYDFMADGDVTPDGLKGYLENLEKEEEQINAYEKPFDSKVLSDESLGVVKENAE